MATLTVNQILKTGLDVTSLQVAVAAGGDEFVNDGKDTFVHIKNTNGATRDVTFATQVTVDGEAVGDKVVTIPATTGDKKIGPFPTAWYNDSASKVQITYESDAGVTIAVYKL